MFEESQPLTIKVEPGEEPKDAPSTCWNCHAPLSGPPVENLATEAYHHRDPQGVQHAKVEKPTNKELKFSSQRELGIKIYVAVEIIRIENVNHITQIGCFNGATCQYLNLPMKPLVENFDEFPHKNFKKVDGVLTFKANDGPVLDPLEEKQARERFLAFILDASLCGEPITLVFYTCWEHYILAEFLQVKNKDRFGQNTYLAKVNNIIANSLVVQPLPLQVVKKAKRTPVKPLTIPEDSQYDYQTGDELANLLSQHYDHLQFKKKQYKPFQPNIWSHLLPPFRTMPRNTYLLLSNIHTDWTVQRSFAINTNKKKPSGQPNSQTGGRKAEPTPVQGKKTKKKQKAQPNNANPPETQKDFGQPKEQKKKKNRRKRNRPNRIQDTHYPMVENGAAMFPPRQLNMNENFLPMNYGNDMNFSRSTGLYWARYGYGYQNEMREEERMLMQMQDFNRRQQDSMQNSMRSYPYRFSW